MIYIKPPRGDILLSELHDCVTSRMNYFLYHYKQDSSISKDNIKFQYLTLGTALDRTGHFMLRFLSAQSEYLKDFVVSSEATFIIERLEFLTSKQILQQIATTLRHINECGSNTTWITEIKYIFTEIKNAFKASHMINLAHDENCTSHSIKVPFQMCLSLVAKREFAMEKGNAVVPCGKWKLFLKHLFTAHLLKEISIMQRKELLFQSMCDERLQELRDSVLHQFAKPSLISVGGTNTDASELDKMKVMFPPCMRYLYNNLKTNHRLSHNARFSFSLFLKDIGMSLNESIAFWQAEYSKPSKCVAKCSHCWQKNSGRYVYSIRHLYGLEGKRAKYSAPSCSKIQTNNLGPMEEGGCPFLNFDQERLENLLEQNNVEKNEEYTKILLLSSQGQGTAACDCYWKTLINGGGKDCHKDTTQHNSPVEYFIKIKKYLDLDVR